MHDKMFHHLLKEAQSEFAQDNMVIMIPKIFGKKFIAYCAMREDLLLALRYIKLLKSEKYNEENTIKSALTYSIVTMYGKCFTDASKDRYPKLESSVIFKNEYADLMEVHLEIMNIRHKFIAHRGETKNELGVSFLVYPNDYEEDPQLRFKQLKLNGFGDVQLAKFEEIIDYLVSFVEGLIENNGKRLSSRMLKEFSLKELATLSINHVKFD